MTTEKVVSNYTAEQTANAVIDYLAGTSVELIAERLGKSARSVIAKLSREKVYVAKVRTSAGRVTKADLVAQIAAKAGVSVDVVASLEKATHEALEAIAAM
jgi:hypothetical protein